MNDKFLAFIAIPKRLWPACCRDIFFSKRMVTTRRTFLQLTMYVHSYNEQDSQECTRPYHLHFTSDCYLLTTDAKIVG